MKEALQVVFLFKKPSWDYYARWPYIAFGIVAWTEVILVLIALLLTL